jgi:hypothetical protein
MLPLTRGKRVVSRPSLDRVSSYVLMRRLAVLDQSLFSHTALRRLPLCQASPILAQSACSRSTFCAANSSTREPVSSSKISSSTLSTSDPTQFKSTQKSRTTFLVPPCPFTTQRTHKTRQEEIPPNNLMYLIEQSRFVLGLSWADHVYYKRIVDSGELRLATHSNQVYCFTFSAGLPVTSWLVEGVDCKQERES